MIDLGHSLEKFLINLLIFLLPTQLAFHFWPNFAFVFGIRVDYLSPSIYLTDILFIALFLFWVVRNYSEFLLLIKKVKFYLLVFLAIALINTVFSTLPLASFYKWIKLTEFGAFAFYVWARKDLFKSKEIYRTLYFSLMFFSLIGILQFVLGRTLGGAFYFLGERSFNISTPGIALVEVVGRSFLRAYSTFSHPNSFAGYLGVGLIILTLSYLTNCFSKRNLGFLIILSAFLLTFSLSAFLAVGICVVMFLMIKKGLFIKKGVFLFTVLVFVISLLLPLFSNNLLRSSVLFQQSVSQRLELSLVAGKMISEKFWIGEGLNTFVVNEIKYTGTGSYVWLLQPVHNIFLLIFAEVGVVGIVVLFLFLKKVLEVNLIQNNIGLFLAVVFILITGLFDHYWFTLQQNLFLLAFIAGNSFRVRS